MTDRTAATTGGLLLPGLDGSTPLGFLAALGTMQTLAASQPDSDVRMSWKRNGLTWSAVIHGSLIGSSEDAAQLIAKHLRCPFTPKSSYNSGRADAQKRFDGTRKKLKDATEALKKRRLKGKERENVEKRELDPLRKEVEETRHRWLEALKLVVPSVELCLGKHLNADVAEFRDVCVQSLQQSSLHDREVVDLLASFGSDACRDEKSNQMKATPFCFITGSGHQYFLDTVRQLAEKVDVARIVAVLSGSSEPLDEKLSLRWSPVEDRRYALMGADPTASGNKTLTSWALNLLAYRGLQLVPSIPTARGLRTSGWTRSGGIAWSWPIWQGPLSLDVVRSVMSMEALTRSPPDPVSLSAAGVEAVHRAARIQVGKPPLHKINFTPSRRIA